MTRLVRFAAIAAVAFGCVSGAQSVRAQETCFGIPDNDPDVCSGHGTCTGPDTCSCDAGYVGNECQYAVCFSIPDNDPNVCSGHGACTGPDTCSCDAGYTGNECQYAVCFGVPSSDPSVCSGHGTCTGPDTCSCDAGYTGNECQYAVCFSIPDNDPNVCSGHGTCTGPDTCSCQVGFIGDECESLVIQTVTVGNPGNTGENSGESEPGGYGPDRICGAVDYVYNIGTFEVTAGQYAEFLNAVADDDTYGLYNTYMADPSGSWGCNIQRSGSSPNYSYSVAGDWADRPVSHVSWGDAARFANWMHNGQPTGPQDLSTTEDGSYYLNGATSNAALMAVVREPDARWVIPSEDEWYKAAYYDGGGSVYYDYPTSTDSVPSNDLIDPDPGNNANFYEDEYTIGSPYYRTVVGDFENSESPYDTFDQGGNVWEWNEAVIGSYRGLRGGSFYSSGVNLHAADRDYGDPTYEYSIIGFRVAEVSEPGPDIPTVSEWGMVTMALLVLTAGTLVWARRSTAIV